MNEHYMQLTDLDKIILQSYSMFVENLGSYLGEGYEIILHSLELLDSSIIQIYNGHYSGRKIGAPITDFALSMLSKIENNTHHDSITYFNKSKTGEKLRSCTIPIEGENKRIIGLICINFHTDIPLESLLKKFYPTNFEPPKEHEVKETFTENVDDLIIEALNKAKDDILLDPSISPQNKNKEIVINLYNHGIFNLKDAVIKVANELNISKNTVYMHIRNIKN